MRTTIFKDRSGNFALTAAVLSLPLFGAAAFAVDYVNAASYRADIQNAVDAAVLSAASSNKTTEAELRIVAEEALRGNLPKGVRDDVSVKGLVVSADGRVTLTVDGVLPSTFAHLFNFDTLKVNVAAQASRPGSQSLEVALVLDNTGSMKGQKLADLKTATLEMITTFEQATELKTKMGVVPFGDYVNVGLGNRGRSWLQVEPDSKSRIWRGCVGSRANPDDTRKGRTDRPIPGLMNVACVAPILPLTDKFDSVRTAVSAMQANGLTYVPAGVLWGWHVLAPGEPFAEAAKPAKTLRKFMIVMTDGANTRSPTYPSHTGTNIKLADDKMVETCTNAKADGIEIFTVAVGIDNAATRAELAKCASSPANAIAVSESRKLKQTFQDIAAQILRVRLTM